MSVSIGLTADLSQQGGGRGPVAGVEHVARRKIRYGVQLLACGSVLPHIGVDLRQLEVVKDVPWTEGDRPFERVLRIGPVGAVEEARSEQGLREETLQRREA